MKKSIKNKPKEFLYYFNFAVFFLCGNVIFSQTITKRFEKEISVSSEEKVEIKGPGSLPFESRGSLTLNTENGYALVPRDNNGVPAFIAQTLHIKASKDEKLRQVIDVNIVPHEKSPKDAEALLKALELDILRNGKSYRMNNNMNIERLSFSNGFLKGTKNWIRLTNGKKYNVRSIEISASVQIPENLEVFIDAKYIDIMAKEFNGELHLKADNSSIYIDQLQSLKAELKTSKIEFSSIQKASIFAYNTSIEGKSVDTLMLGKANTRSEESLFSGHNTASVSRYTIDEIDFLNITTTTSDEFRFKTIGSLNIASSFFSNYSIQMLEESLTMNAKHGDIIIEEISNKIKEVDINNQLSKISLGVHNLQNYRVLFPKGVYTEKELPPNLNTSLDNGTEIFTKGTSTNSKPITIRCNSCKVYIKD